MSFQARYHGECAACGWHVSPGQEVEYDAEDNIVHVFCPEKEPLRAMGEICGTCFQEKSKTGECGCG